MLIVAIGALDELFVHPMPEGFPEFRGSLQVAGVTEGGLLLREQKLLLLGEMGRMAVNTAHIIIKVLGTLKIGVLLAVLVAGQAARAAFCGGDILKIKDLRRISPPSHMLPPWSVASFTPLPGRTSASIQRRFPMGGLFKIAEDVCVAGLTDFGSHVLG